MKNLLKLIFLFIVQISFAQNFSVIKAENFSGVIISKEYFSGKSDMKCFTPTEKEIYDLEKIITEIQNKKEIRANRYITSNIDFSKYIRQYSGLYIREEKVIFIQFVLKEIIENRKLKWTSEYLSSIDIDKCISMNYFIKEQKFYELSVCGDY
ncbi:hypothetical protein [Flavobacterium hercynium]|uniref:Uncharacterized protein n=1 Tax=Flavobacterium hercynium TaxID=387094 RepID=A0A226GSL5_9FLAO|nr:hypothetical protein [Flavobacterium hercynium]OXA84957.1 hypothetical protein B0A66_20060 [Flavobacterium hercynium]SMP35031.1 hypothetical protein SAMN06265346_11929 [Flavobacterium hercynium]